MSQGRITVNSAELSSAAAKVMQLAEDVSDTASDVSAAIDSGQGAAGKTPVANALAAFGAVWGVGLMTLANNVDGFGASVESSAGNYQRGNDAVADSFRVR